MVRSLFVSVCHKSHDNLTISCHFKRPHDSHFGRSFYCHPDRRFTVIPSGCLFVISTDRREWRIFTITEMASGGLSGYN